MKHAFHIVEQVDVFLMAAFFVVMCFVCAREWFKHTRQRQGRPRLEVSRMSPAPLLQQQTNDPV